MSTINEEDEKKLNIIELIETISHISRRMDQILDETKDCVPAREMVMEDILKMINHEFGCDLTNIKRKCIADIHEFIDSYELPICLREKVKDYERKSN